MKSKAILFALFMVVISHAHAQWVIQRHNQGYINNLRAISVSDNGFGFCMGNDLNGDGLILNTINSGEEWIEIVNPFTSTIQDYYYNENGTLYVVSGHPAFGPGQFAASYNGGENWDNVWDLGFSVRSISYVNPDTGTICINDYLSTTLNGPYQWSHFWSLSEHGYSSGEFHDVRIAENGIGYACGYYHNSSGQELGVVIKTYNYGISWDTVFLPDFNSEFYSLYFLNSEVGFMGGYEQIYKTTDGGLTWTIFDIYCGWRVNSIHFPSDSIGYAVAGEPIYSWGALFKTTDGGESWIEDLFYDYELFDVSFNNDTVGYCSGNAETILYTEHGGGAIINSLADYTNSQLHVNAYPNPFTISTTIEYELKEISNIQFIVYNVIGEIVYETGNRMMPQGYHSVTWSPSHLPVGLYYVMVRSEEEVAVVKMVKQ